VAAGCTSRRPITSASILKNEAAEEGIDPTPHHSRVHHGQCRCSEEEGGVDATTMGGKTRGRGDIDDMWTSIKDATDRINLNSVTRIEMPMYPLLLYSLDVGCGNAMGVGSLLAIIDARQAATGEKMRMRR
jgi:hypothetical protein